MKLYSYSQYSKSAALLAAALGVVRVRHTGKVAKTDVLINWGASLLNFTRDIRYKQILNPPEKVGIAVNKLTALQALSGYVRIPEFATSIVEASKWLDEGAAIVERHTLTGHSGAGIRIVAKGEKLQHAPLYTQYIRKAEEYRLHVFNKQVFFVQRKARNLEIENVNWKVRNLANGFIFAHQGVDVPDEAKSMAIASIRALGLDFGAVDMIYNERHDKYYVLEVNTACGLEGTTLTKYCEVFNKFKEEYND